MKKNYMLVLLMFVTGYSFAQVRFDGVEGVIPERHLESKGKISNYEKGTTQSWFDYTAAYAALYGSTPVSSINYLYPDSHVTAQFGTSYSNPWIHHVSQTYDITALPFNGHQIRTHAPFAIDSLMIHGIYTRVNNAVVDTLEVSTYMPGAGNLSSRGAYAPGTYVDTAFFLVLDWDAATQSIPGAVSTYKIPLNDAFFADSLANGTHLAWLATENNGVKDTVQPVTNPIFSGKFAISYRFVPGETWTLTDTLGVNKNYWTFIADELDGADTYPAHEKTNYNTSNIVTSQVYYQTGGAIDYCFPWHAYSKAYGFESLSMSVKLSQDDKYVGVAESLASKVTFAVYPNPTNGEAVISLKSNEMNQQATITVMNILGEEVLMNNVSVNGAVRHEIDLSSYGAGVYFVSVLNNGVRNTQRLIVE